MAVPRESGSLLRLAHLTSPSARPDPLTFSIWASELHAYDIDGKSVWTHPSTGIDDVCAARIVEIDDRKGAD